MLGVAILGLVVPASAMASTEHVVTNKVTKAGGFKLSFIVQQGQKTGYGGRYPNSVTVNLNRTSGKATQSNQYSFFGGVHFSGSKKLNSGHFTAKFAKNRGSLNMSFHPKGSSFTVHAPAGCRGKGTAHRGTLSGSFKIKADKLGTIKVKSIPATMSTANFTCNGTPKGVYLFQQPPGKKGINASLVNGTANISVFSSTRGKGYNFLYTYSIKGPASDYMPSADLKTAKLTGSNGIQGTATFSGKSKIGHNAWDGIMSGSTFHATMKSIGTITPFPKPAPNYTQQKS